MKPLGQSDLIPNQIEQILGLTINFPLILDGISLIAKNETLVDPATYIESGESSLFRPENDLLQFSLFSFFTVETKKSPLLHSYIHY